VRIALPPNARVGAGTVIAGDRVTEAQVFRKFASRLDPGLVIGAGCHLDGVCFNVGEHGFVSIGNDCRFEEVFLIAEQEIRIGDRVTIGWRATIVDCDFHPLAPAERLTDAVACSPLANGARRPELACRAVVIEDDVWIGPNATILKGVQIGAGAFVEPGAVVVQDVPRRARVLGNPARTVGSV
jgi:acetyltransferase-like isoleucine patch superfamily enzyme